MDFLGGKDAAERFAQAVHGTLKMEGPREPTIALVKVRDKHGQEHGVDFLEDLHIPGLTVERIRETAIHVELRDATGSPSGVAMRVLHPVLCLTSRVHNAYSFGEKYRSPGALRQLSAAIGWARRFVCERCDSNDLRAARRAIKQIAEIACTPAGQFSVTLGLDPLDAIPHDARLGEKFFRDDLPRIRGRAGRGDAKE